MAEKKMERECKTFYCDRRRDKYCCVDCGYRKKCRNACDRRRDKYCCVDCGYRKKCRNACRNHPDKCGYCLSYISSSGEEKK